MNVRLVFRNISLLLLLTISACSKPTATPSAAPLPTQPPAGTEAPVATEGPITSGGGMPVAGSGQCANTYYPVREGATWTYKSTGSPAGDFGYTDTISSVREDGFTLTSQFANVTRTQEWACKPEGLVALQLGGGAVTSQNLKLQVDSQNATGVTYPTEIKVGDQWDYALDFTGKMEIAGNSGAATGSDKNHFNALGEESVTVPAGTFDALKIQVDTALDIQVTYQGLTVPVTLKSSYNYWYAQGVGWVKASGTASMAGESFTETIELQSYSIP